VEGIQTARNFERLARSGFEKKNLRLASDNTTFIRRELTAEPTRTETTDSFREIGKRCARKSRISLNVLRAMEPICTFPKYSWRRCAHMIWRGGLLADIPFKPIKQTASPQSNFEA
jgi:hypothetical protein